LSSNGSEKSHKISSSIVLLSTKSSKDSPVFLFFKKSSIQKINIKNIIKPTPHPIHQPALFKKLINIQSSPVVSGGFSSSKSLTILTVSTGILPTQE
jgi:hypothetical protein